MAVDLDGSTHFTADVPFLESGASFTFGFVVEFDDSDTRDLVGRSGGPSNSGWFIRRPFPDVVRFQGRFEFLNLTAAASGDRVRICVSYDSSTLDYRLVANSQHTAKTSNSGGEIQPHGTLTTIGVNDSVFSGHDGRLSEVFAVDRVLSRGQMEAFGKGLSPRFLGKLNHYWPLYNASDLKDRGTDSEDLTVGAGAPTDAAHPPLVRPTGPRRVDDGVVVVPPSLTQIERGIRGLNRGVMLGGCC